MNVKVAGLDNGEKETVDRLRRVLMKSMFKMEELAIDKAPFDRGNLRLQIKVLPEILADKYVLTSGADYSEDLEFGNTPRDVKWEDIESWVRRKGIKSTESDIYTFTKYVVEKIRTEGVNAQPFMRPSFHEVNTFWFPQFRKEEFSR
jgi:hypothetical protein